jgi:ferredoxin-type protein NapH
VVHNISSVKELIKKKGASRKTIRYFRWSVKAAFLLIFVLPIIHLMGAPPLLVYSFFYGGLNQPFLALPYGQSVCTMWILAWGYIGPGAWLICPVGGLQAVLTGRAPPGVLLLPGLLATIIAVLVFLIPIFALGNVFCGWICPLGTMIDSFDKSVELFMPKVNTKRVERLQRSKEKEEAGHCSFVCPACPFMRLLGNKHGTAANEVLVSALVGSAVFRVPIFCTICPIGISTKGMVHLKALTSVTGRMMPIIVELWAIPVVAILASLREKRYFCRKICPVGALLNIAGSFSPLIKPTVKAEKCVMKGCPKDCEDYRLDYCGACRQADQNRCEKVCPQNINLLDKGSLAKCTKCLECYIQCERNAICIRLFGMPDAVSSLKRFFKVKLKRQPKNRTN